MDLAALGVVKDVGVPVAVAGVALWACWSLATRQLAKLEERLDKKEAECAGEREAHTKEREAHSASHLAAISAVVGKLELHSARLDQHGQALNVIGEGVRDLVRRTG